MFVDVFVIFDLFVVEVGSNGFGCYGIGGDFFVVEFLCEVVGENFNGVFYGCVSR